MGGYHLPLESIAIRLFSLQSDRMNLKARSGLSILEGAVGVPNLGHRFGISTGEPSIKGDDTG